MMISSSHSMTVACALPVSPNLAPAGGGTAAPGPATQFTQALDQAKPAAEATDAAPSAGAAATSSRQVPRSTLPPEREAPAARRGPPRRLPADNEPRAKDLPKVARQSSADALGSVDTGPRIARAAAAESGKLRAPTTIKPDPRALPAEGEPPAVIDQATTGAIDSNLLRPFAPPDCYGGPLTPMPAHLQPDLSTPSSAAAPAESSVKGSAAALTPAATVDAVAQTAAAAGAMTAGSTATPGTVREALLQAAQAAQAAQSAKTTATLPPTATTSSTAASTAAYTTAPAVVPAAAPAAAVAAAGAGTGRQSRTEAAVANLDGGAASTETAPAAAVLPAGVPAAAQPTASPNVASTPVAARHETGSQAPIETTPSAEPGRASGVASSDTAGSHTARSHPAASDAAAPFQREATAAQAPVAGPTEPPQANRPQAHAVTTAVDGAAAAVSPSAAGAAGREAEHRDSAAAADTGKLLPMPGSVGTSAISAYRAANAAAAAEARLSASPGSADFAPQFGSQITTFVRNGIEHAQLHLNPAEMGPVSVRIQLEGQTAQVHLSADHALTRQALEASMPQLASQLSEAGLTLGGGGVFEQPRQGREATAQDGSGQPGQPDRGDGGRQRGSALAAPEQPPMRRGVVDLVA